MEEAILHNDYTYINNYIIDISINAILKFLLSLRDIDGNNLFDKISTNMLDYLVNLNHTYLSEVI